MSTFERWFPPLVVVLGALFLIGSMLPPRDSAEEMHVYEFGQLPVLYNGRVQPLDTLARTSLLIVSDRQTFRDASGKRQPAIRWLLDVVSASRRPKGAKNPGAECRVFRIDNDQLLGLLDLNEREGFRYSFRELEPNLPKLGRQILAIQEKEKSQRDAFDNKVAELVEQLQIYEQLSRRNIPDLVPPAAPGGQWLSLPEATQAGSGAVSAEQAADAWRLYDMLGYFAAGETEKFNTALAEYRQSIVPRYESAISTARFETFFNHFAPFYQCSVLYVVVYLLAVFGWLGWSRPLWSAAFWLLALTLVVHTFAIIARMYIQGRPPVTNLYSSAVFIGWGAVALGLVLERISRNGLGSALGATIGFATLIVAHHLAMAGDTLEMMQAVLDTNFWLATHVVAITIGYTATFVTGALGAIYILMGVFTRALDREATKRLTSMTYGVLCFATLFSFVGTVLGGIWADQSWGRFWGWDSKENGALLIVIWNSLVLHARWGGMVRARGIAVMAVFGNIVTAWSWFGTNQLGVGLHSYGFTESATMWIAIFMLSQLFIMGIGLLPESAWASYEGRLAVDVKKTTARGPRRRATST